MPRRITIALLRQGVLRASVVYDIDLAMTTRGVRLPGRPPIRVPWAVLRTVLGGHDPTTAAGADRLGSWLQLVRWVSGKPESLLPSLVRPYGVPVGHPSHPGPGWAQLRVMGDALELGMALVDIDPADRDRVVPVPATVWEVLGIEASAWWPEAMLLLNRLAILAAERWRNDSRERLCPMGDCDVVTLLGSRALRQALADSAGGMRAAVVPMRRRGWTKLSFMDPAFGPAAATLTDESERGFERPLLVTRDEIVLVPPGGRPVPIEISEAMDLAGWDKDVLYR